MSGGPPTTRINRLRHLAQEYLTHWAVAGIIVALTGVAPDHWMAHLLHVVNLDSLRASLPIWITG